MRILNNLLVVSLLLAVPVAWGIKVPRRLRRRLHEDRKLKAGKAKNKDNKGGNGNPNPFVSNTVAAPTDVPYVSPNGAMVSTVVVRPASGSPGATNSGASAPAPGPVNGPAVMTVSATTVVTPNTPGGGGSTPASAPGPMNGPISSAVGEGNNGATATAVVSSGTSGGGNNPAGSPAGGNAGATVTVTATTSVSEPVPAPGPINGPISSAMVAPPGTEASGTTPGAHVSPQHCANGSWHHSLDDITEFTACTQTDMQCNQAMGECCLAAFCLCGNPKGDILGRCVPNYDFDLLQATINP